jgi:Phage protein
MNDACYGIPAEEIAQRCRVDVRTARRWKVGERRMPKTAAMILSGDLGCFDSAWTGWKLHDGKLISPEGIEASPGDVVALPFMCAQIAAYQAEQRRVQGLEEQPDPASVGGLLIDRALRG